MSDKSEFDLVVEAQEARIDRALAALAARKAEDAALTHDVRDRRPNNMQAALDALDGFYASLHKFADNPGMVLLVADQIRRLRSELAGFRARDLINMREAAR